MTLRHLTAPPELTFPYHEEQIVVGAKLSAEVVATLGGRGKKRKRGARKKDPAKRAEPKPASAQE